MAGLDIGPIYRCGPSGPSGPFVRPESFKGRAAATDSRCDEKPTTDQETPDVESCPHCHFLMRDDAVECGVCHRPRVVVSTEGFAVVDDSRVGAGRSTGVPVAIVVMLFLVLAAGTGLLVSTQSWI